MVPPCSVNVSRAPTYSISLNSGFGYGAITHYGGTFQSLLLPVVQLKGWSPFARRYLGNLGWFLFLGVLRCFSSPGSPLTPMYSVQDTQQAGWVSPFGYLRIKACLTAPRSLSWPTTSFIASNCQGIHHVRLVAWPYNHELYLDNSLKNNTLLRWGLLSFFSTNFMFHSNYIFMSITITIHSYSFALV